MADDGIVDRAMEANGYTINQNGGTYRHGVARPIEDKASAARVYLELLAAAEADPTKVVSVRDVAHCWALYNCLDGYSRYPRTFEYARKIAPSGRYLELV